MFIDQNMHILYALCKRYINFRISLWTWFLKQFHPILC